MAQPEAIYRLMDQYMINRNNQNFDSIFNQIRQDDLDPSRLLFYAVKNTNKRVVEGLFDIARKNGFNLWKRLVFEIKPNLIILSTRKSYLDSLNPRHKQVLYTVYKTKDGKPRRPFNLEHHQINILGLDIDLVYGEPKNLPFGSVSTEDKIKMGEIIEETFFKTSL